MNFCCTPQRAAKGSGRKPMLRSISRSILSLAGGTQPASPTTTGKRSSGQKPAFLPKTIAP
jgi:hypothetical protein